MEPDMMDASILIVYPKQPFIDWVNDQLKRDNLPTITIENYNDECGVHSYLIPDFEDLSKAKRWLKKNYIVLFEEELTSWTIDETDWPEDLSYKTFLKLFEVEFNLMVFDLRDTC